MFLRQIKKKLGTRSTLEQNKVGDEEFKNGAAAVLISAIFYQSRPKNFSLYDIRAGAGLCQPPRYQKVKKAPGNEIDFLRRI